MEKKQYQSMISFLFLQGKSHSKIKERLKADYGGFSPSMTAVKNWLNESHLGDPKEEEKVSEREMASKTS